jgi:hypothetical protein
LRRLINIVAPSSPMILHLQAQKKLAEASFFGLPD